MGINRRIAAVTEQANTILRRKKSDIVVLVAPRNNDKGWAIDVCNDYRTGEEDTALRNRLEACYTVDELTEVLQGYATNLPNVRRSNEYQ